MSSHSRAGHVLLITHAGVPTEWPVEQSEEDEMEHLLEVFDTACKMCQLELLDGGTLKLFDKDCNVLREVRGRWRSLPAQGPIE